MLRNMAFELRLFGACWDVAGELRSLPELPFGGMVDVVADPLGNTDSYYNLGSYHRALDIRLCANGFALTALYTS